LEDESDFFDETKFELGMKPAQPKHKETLIVKPIEPLFDAKAVKEKMRESFKLDMDQKTFLPQSGTADLEYSTQASDDF
jgi:hypothetical protein